MSAFGKWWSSRDKIRNENEKQILKAVEKNDAKSLKKILKNPIDCRLGLEDTPILSVAVLHGACAVIKYLIDCGCDPRDLDKNGRTALDMILLGPRGSSKDQKRRLNLANILLATYSNPVETVFLNVDKYKMTPFLSACEVGFDLIIFRFLALIDTTNSISMDHVIDSDGDNIFHHLVDSCRGDYPSTRIDTMRALLDKFPYSDQLIDVKNNYGQTPLCRLYMRNRDESRVTIDLAKFFFQHGVSPDTENESFSSYYLDFAIQAQNVSLFETLLRVGCRTDILDKSPLAYLLKCGDLGSSDSRSMKMIELFLAFGYDLQKDLFLYTIDERPIEYSLPEYAKRCKTKNMDANVLEALRELRRSNKMPSLKRQCRNTIRRHLKANADEAIGKLTCIPKKIKSFWLVQKEKLLQQQMEKVGAKGKGEKKRNLCC